jgi:hypothetical protein
MHNRPPQDAARDPHRSSPPGIWAARVVIEFPLTAVAAPRPLRLAQQPIIRYHLPRHHRSARTGAGGIEREAGAKERAGMEGRTCLDKINKHRTPKLAAASSTTHSRSPRERRNVSGSTEWPCAKLLPDQMGFALSVSRRTVALSL